MQRTTGDPIVNDQKERITFRVFIQKGDLYNINFDRPSISGNLPYKYFIKTPHS